MSVKKYPGIVVIGSIKMSTPTYKTIQKLLNSQQNKLNNYVFQFTISNRFKLNNAKTTKDRCLPIKIQTTWPRRGQNRKIRQE